MQITRTTLSIDTPTYRRLVDHARQNERSTSAELRVAIRRHLEGSAASGGHKLVAKFGRGEVGGAA